MLQRREDHHAVVHAQNLEFSGESHEPDRRDRFDAFNAGGVGAIGAGLHRTRT
jgi:hypothetical protein